MKSLENIDTTIFLWLNGLHSPFFDRVMWFASDRFIWIPLYILFLWLLYRKYPKRFWVVLLTIALMILAGDQLSRFFKETVARYRPSQDPDIQHLVHIVNGYTGGAYGFFSGHATNSFAVALFVITLLPANRRFILPLALSYASLVSYSRIYLGVHYPLDVLTGIITGSLIGFGAAKTFLLARRKLLKE